MRSPYLAVTIFGQAASSITHVWLRPGTCDLEKLVDLLPLPLDELAQLTTLPDGRVLASGREGGGCRFALLDPARGQWEEPVSVEHGLSLEDAAVVDPGRCSCRGGPP